MRTNAAAAMESPNMLIKEVDFLFSSADLIQKSLETLPVLIGIFYQKQIRIPLGLEQFCLDGARGIGGDVFGSWP